MSVLLRAPRTGLVAASKRCSSSATFPRLQDAVQSYRSTSTDPFLNLSIEHHLLQTAPEDSAILFLYVNRPSIIIGRNQNPWYEVNLAKLRQPSDLQQPNPGRHVGVDLVRRRSGGGTVFHDHGNVNWTVISPSAAFTRDKHAEMVVRALRSSGVDRARVNARHDIVLDQGEKSGPCDPQDTHQTPYMNANTDGPKSLKVSGSAYKLTRKRALHHGTCLLSSPNLKVIPTYLRSPGRSFITAKGVESVSSPVGNINLDNGTFVSAVQEHFSQLYEHSGAQIVGDDLLDHDQIRKGYDELKSLEWKYLQTPQFSVSHTSSTELSPSLEFSVRHGTVESVSVAGGAKLPGFEKAVAELLVGQRLHEVHSWEAKLRPALSMLDSTQSQDLLDWMHKVLPPTN